MGLVVAHSYSVTGRGLTSHDISLPCTCIWIDPRRRGLSLVPRPHHARARKGSGDIGADSWFCKLSNHVIVCIGFYWRTCGHVMDRTTKKCTSPDPFPRERLGSGNETSAAWARPRPAPMIYAPIIGVPAAR